MPDIRHAITIDAPPERIYPLITSAAGLSRWWAEDYAEDATNGTVELRFFNGTTVYRLKPARRESPRRAEWVCDSGKEWEGTRLIFELAPAAARTRVRFTHSGWREETDYFVDCTTTWGELMFRLKAAAERGVTAPLFLTAGISA